MAPTQCLRCHGPSLFIVTLREVNARQQKGRMAVARARSQAVEILGRVAGQTPLGENPKWRGIALLSRLPGSLDRLAVLPAAGIEER